MAAPGPQGCLFSSPVGAAVVGAGPVGCVTAIGFARQGVEVALLEARPESGLRRLAGEWLHPPAVRVLEDLGIAHELSRREHCRGRGFVVFPEDGGEPIVLPYSGESSALCCEHGILVTALRSAARAHANLRLLVPARMRAIDGQRLRFERDGAAEELWAGLIVGADGRSSRVRAALGIERKPDASSLTAGLLLHDVELPFEGYGHVLLGGPGPALLFRIGPRRVRLCLDLPMLGSEAQSARSAAALWLAFRPALPPSLHRAFQQALAERPVAWNVNHVLPRRHGDHLHVALVGDAVGHFHPLTAAGMTVGFLDAESLVRNPNLASYREERIRRACVPQLLAGVLYQVLQRQDPGAVALRQGIYRLWRSDPDEQRRAMRLLSAEEVRPRVFCGTFLKVLDLAARSAVIENASWQNWRRLVQTLGSLGPWLKFPLSSVFNRAA
jgi:squalene monooxygenase